MCEEVVPELAVSGGQCDELIQVEVVVSEGIGAGPDIINKACGANNHVYSFLACFVGGASGFGIVDVEEGAADEQPYGRGVAAALS